MTDALTRAIESMDSSYFQLKKKFHAKRVAEDEFFMEVERLGLKTEKVKNEATYKIAKLEEKISKLEERLVKQPVVAEDSRFTDEDDVEEKELCLRIASTVSIFENILSSLSKVSDGFKYMGYSVIYPAVYSRLLKGDAEDLMLVKVPDDMDLIFETAVEKAYEVYNKAYSHLSSEKEWGCHSEEVQLWWKLEMLPLIYKGRSDRFFSMLEDHPVWSRDTTLTWVKEPLSRPLSHPEVSDAINMYHVNMFEINSVNGVDEFNSRKNAILESVLSTASES